MRVLAATIALAAAPAFHAWSAPVPVWAQKEIRASNHIHKGCPVQFPQLRLLRVTYWGFDHKVHTGQIVVNENATAALTTVFHKLYDIRFPIRYMSVIQAYGPAKDIPKNDDVTQSFSCRDAVPSPCSSGTSTGHWSMHAYGDAVDLNPLENPYVGCGQTRDKVAVSYMNRARVRPGMVTPQIYSIFASVGWGWGGSWVGSTKDYMHFSTNGH